MIYKGLYHLFYQHNPKVPKWNNNIEWGHSISKDLVNWFPLQPALTPNEPYDIKGCWSGSITILPNAIPFMLYTGTDHKNHQTQNLAIPKNLSDPLLREWVKLHKNPLMKPTLDNKINVTSFRDPTTAWLGHDGFWRVIVGSQENKKGIAILYKSKDFLHWIKAKHPLSSAKKSGMWECPDFFPVSIKGKIGIDTSIGGDQVRHVLKVSLFDTSHDYYLIGTYDTTKDVFVPDDEGFDKDELYLVQRYDYGKFYASKTFYDDAKKRRVLWGWINESSLPQDDLQKGWSGIQAIPRTVWLHESGKQLIQWPIPEIEKLRSNHVKLHSKELKPGTLLEVSGITAAQADVEVSFEVNKLENAPELNPNYWKLDPQIVCSQKAKGGGFGMLVLASKGMQEYTSVFFMIFRANKKYVVLMCSDQSRSSLNHHNDLASYGAFVNVDPVHEELSLRILIDNSVVESFGGKGKACITSRVYPTLAINDKAHLHAFNNGTLNVNITRLSAWSMKKAKVN
ncbi:Fructan 6-exohydrolase [Stylosanthes scabra]|uniref:Fructan 6-exohydrolase n=1 Tax=Stylosanthes scabra TaxID=79078 RepID=A0ABU6WBI8_9FABA|nr:Fructan 6-exohydrolase [Stylosanthes scabra]